MRRFGEQIIPRFRSSWDQWPPLHDRV